MFRTCSPANSFRIEDAPDRGIVAAGQPIEAVQSSETISLEDIIGRKKCFVLKLRGDSMQDEHIVDGDYGQLEKTKKGTETSHRCRIGGWI
jgi:repressor LexA